MNQTQASTPGIHKLPNELIVEILKLTFVDDTPSQDIATVCKHWKALQLDNPIFWKKMRAYFIGDDRLAFHASRLQRRLELSQDTLIHVTLDVSAYKEDYSKRLFEILGTVNVRRWQSLRLESTGRTLPVDCIAGLFNGSFTSLNSLYLENTIGDPYQPIHELLAQSPPSLRVLYTEKPIPELLLKNNTLRKLVNLTIPAQFYGQIAEKAPIETVHLTHSHNVPPTLIPSLPKGVKIAVASNEMLSELDLRAVQDLELLYYVDRGETKIEMPILESLFLPKSIIHIKLFVTPSLKHLRLGHDNLWGKEKVADSQRIVELFKKDHEHIYMAPTSLDMHLTITAASTIAILTHWSQLQHLILHLTEGDRFSWEGAFANGLKKSSNPLCPNLITLKLRTRWDGLESEKWERTARGMFKARSTGPLEIISWIYRIDERELVSILRREDC